MSVFQTLADFLPFPNEIVKIFILVILMLQFLCGKDFYSCYINASIPLWNTG